MFFMLFVSFVLFVRNYQSIAPTASRMRALTSISTPILAMRIAEAIEFALAEPWQIMQVPLTPSKLAPP